MPGFSAAKAVRRQRGRRPGRPGASAAPARRACAARRSARRRARCRRRRRPPTPGSSAPAGQGEFRQWPGGEHGGGPRGLRRERCRRGAEARHQPTRRARQVEARRRPGAEARGLRSLRRGQPAARRRPAAAPREAIRARGGAAELDRDHGRALSPRNAPPPAGRAGARRRRSHPSARSAVSLLLQAVPAMSRCAQRLALHEALDELRRGDRPARAAADILHVGDRRT